MQILTVDVEMEETISSVICDNIYVYASIVLKIELLCTNENKHN